MRVSSLWMCVVAVSLGACSGGVSSTDTSATAAASEFTVGGTVSGLSGSNLMLQNNGGDNLAISADGSFTFATPLLRGDSYSVTVLSEPSKPTQTCAVAHGSGAISTANVTAVTLTCAAKTSAMDTIGGVALGVMGSGLMLQNNNGDKLAVPSNGPFTFVRTLEGGVPYQVSVLTPPINPYQDCAVSNGAGTTGSANVTNVAVSCTTNTNTTYTISGNATGIPAGEAVVLQDNNRDNLLLTGDGPFHFAIPIPSGSTYNVTALQVSGQESLTCTLTHASGTVTGAVTNVTVACQANVLVAVTVTGLSGTGLVLQDNGGDNLAVTKSGLAHFATALASGTPYTITVLTPPSNPTQNCSVTGASGSAGSTPTATVTCTPPPSFTVGGTVTGLIATTGVLPQGLVLQLNGGSNLPIADNVAFTFNGTVYSGDPYNVTILGEPSGYACAVANGTGTVVDAAVNNVGVSCSQIGGFLYVTNGGSNDISGFAIDLNSGGLQPLTGVVASAGQPNAIVAASGGKLPTSIVSGCALPAVNNADYSPATIYIANSGSGIVSSFSVNTSVDLAAGGTLTPINSYLAAGDITETLDSNEHNAPCNIFALTDPIPSSVSGPREVLPSDFILSFTTDAASGALVVVNEGVGYPTGPDSAPIAADHVFVNNDGALNLEFVANQVSNDVLTYLVDANGALSLIGSQVAPVTNPVPAGTTPSALVATALPTILNEATFADPYVYVVNHASNNISEYQGNPFSGLLSPIGTVATGKGPTSLVLLSGLLYVTNGVDGSISAYSVETSATAATGTLTDLTLTFATGTTPVAVKSANVNGSYYLYVVNQQSNDVYAYSVNLTAGIVPAFGALTLVGKYAVGSAPTSLSIPFSVFPQLTSTVGTTHARVR